LFFVTITPLSCGKDARTMPAHGRVSQKSSRVWRRGRDGLHCPSPSPQGFPLFQEKLVRFAPPRCALPRKPFIDRSKGEEQPSPRGRWLSGSKKCRHPCRPAPAPPQRGVLRPPIVNPPLTSNTYFLKSRIFYTYKHNSLPYKELANLCRYKIIPTLFC
jgi:hypothetical protein